MSDGVAVTPGTGVTIATDDAGAAGHVQLVKLAISTDGSATLSPNSSTDGLLVNLGANNDVTVTGTVTSNHATTGISNGRKVTVSAGTAVALATSTTAKWVTVTAETDNTGLVVVGGSGVVAALSTRQGTPLYAGESFGPIPIDNLADVYIDTTVSGDGVTFTYGTGA